MNVYVPKRLLLSSLYLGALFLVAGTVFYRLQAFTGVVFLQKGAAEHLAFRIAQGGLGIGVAQRGVMPELLLLDNPRVVQALRADQRYDALVLPYALQLDGVEIIHEPAPRHWLHVSGPETEQRIAVETGDTVSLGMETAEITGIGPWEGLVNSPSGRPMAALTVRGDDAEESSTLFLEAGPWYVLRPDLALHFQWHATERELQEALAAPDDPGEGARWGVRDGKAVQWFENFTIGTGTRLRNGTRIVLVETSESLDWVTLRVTGEDGDHTVKVAANEVNSTAPFIFENPAAAAQRVALHAWREDQVVCRLRVHGQPRTDTAIVPGATSPILPGGPVLHLKQCLAKAVAVPGGQINAVFMRAQGATRSLREGLAETVGDFRIRYEREQLPPDARYEISVLDSTGAMLQPIVLEKGKRRRVGAWVFSLAEENPFAPAGIAVAAVRRPGGAGQYIGLGLFIFGSFGLIVARFGRPKPADD